MRSLNCSNRKLNLSLLSVYLPFFLLSLSLSGCSTKAIPGPDKQGAGVLQGAALGATSGAIVGAQVGAGTGPGLFVGAGFGALAGSVKGILLDNIEEKQLELAEQIKLQRELASVHELLREHYERRLELHPTRDIYPADWFFFGDESKLKPRASRLVEVIARLNKERLPWSRMAVTSYVVSKDEDAYFSQHLARIRAKEIVNEMIRAGLDPRRIEPRAVLVEAPVLVDPQDDANRYYQAIELIPLDY